MKEFLGTRNICLTICDMSLPNRKYNLIKTVFITPEGMWINTLVLYIGLFVIVVVDTLC